MNKIYFILIITFSMFTKMVAQQKNKPNTIKHLFVGTYTEKGSEGIYIYKFNIQTGDFELVTNTNQVKNPTFLELSKNGKIIYAANEIGQSGQISTFSFDEKEGKITLLNSVSAQGDDPCHLQLNNENKLLVVGNYSGGNLSMYEVNNNGSLKENPQVINHQGTGPNKDRQEKPHVHSVNWAPNNKDLYVADLGIDKIMHYQLNKTTGKLEIGTPPFTEIDAGAGPRHLTFHPNGKFVYVIQELADQITGFSIKNGSFSKIETIKTIPPDFKGVNYTADIHISPDGRFLYGSNRGHNSLAIYSINQTNGKLKLIDNQSVMGDWPRNFMIEPTGKFLLVANQKTDNIVIFKINKTTGKLKPTGKQIKVSMPVCLKMN
jgi:6-phosphogluconolactonase